MATVPINSRKTASPNITSMREAVKLLSREERFMATVAAMNTLLIEKGVYTQQEFDEIFCQWAEAQVSKLKRQRV
jgi:hypothetical protein